MKLFVPQTAHHFEGFHCIHMFSVNIHILFLYFLWREKLGIVVGFLS